MHAGGSAVAEWLTANLYGVVTGAWRGGSAPQAAITGAYLEADKQLLVSKGFLGLGEEQQQQAVATAAARHACSSCWPARQ
jgi:hypothetical protein